MTMPAANIPEHTSLPFGVCCSFTLTNAGLRTGLECPFIAGFNVQNYGNFYLLGTYTTTYIRSYNTYVYWYTNFGYTYTPTIYSKKEKNLKYLCSFVR